MTISMKFSHKILLAAGLVVALTFSGFTVFNDYQQREGIRTQTAATLKNVGALVASNMQTWLISRIQLLESMAQQVARSGPGADVLPGIVGLPVYSANFQSSYFGSQDGQMYSVPARNRPKDYDPRTRDWYKASASANRTVVTEPYVAVSSGKLVMTIASPVHRAGPMIGVIGADFDLTQVSDIINSLDFNGHGRAFLMNGEGKVLIHPDPQLVLKTLSDAYPEGAPALREGLQEVRGDGKPQFLMLTHLNGVPSANWYVAVVLDQDAAFAMLKEVRASALVAMIIAVVVIIALLGLLIRVLMIPLHVMGRAMHDIAAGESDLTRRLSVHGVDEFGTLAASFNKFVERIHDSIREVSSATAQVSEVTLSVVDASNASMRNSDQQASRTSSVAAAINELGAATQEIAQNAALASQHSSAARGLAVDGQQVVEDTIGSLKRLSAKIGDSCTNIEVLNVNTVNIGQILEVITAISQQTNLLALNAAIEAARAGEAGRGFAVVADEVRNLAHRTQNSAQQVQRLIEELQQGARQAVSTMNESQCQSETSAGIANQAGDRLCSVTQSIGEIDGMNQSVATATEEQTAVVESINQDITELNMLNQRGVGNLQTTLQACTDLKQQVGRLKHLVSSFRI
ncbi:methyl-accepting chemotaxis protein [Pseudomonas sp. G.S.17]|uniref:methyl-accepting chemotaxis protein n=2 Tax=Pseudomonas sp. G.S.17 TaxID=3137451 RepID=UPI00311C9A69